ncbi:ATP-binding cassette domain-containing protein [Lactobacillus sp. XV13L]|nr:ATP-binding cassette domain-containing protein [Lactobacillus sp. XV13L]
MIKNEDVILEVKNLNKNFGKKQVLQNVCFKIPRGQIIGLVGPNGAGKSTIMKCILGLYTYHSGEILFHGHKGKLNLENQIGSLIESPALYPFLTGRQHFDLYGADSIRMSHIIEALNLSRYLDRKVTSYSLGMKQKLGIALAFVDNPELVILDEPMNGLDPIANLELRQFILSEVNNGVTFIISSHILSELEKLITQVILVNNGTVTVQMSLAALQNQEQQYFEISTDNNSKIQLLLQKIGINSVIQPEGLKIENASHNLKEIIQILAQSQVNIQDITNKRTDLETSLTRLFKAKTEVV